MDSERREIMAEDSAPPSSEAVESPVEESRGYDQLLERLVATEAQTGQLERELAEARQALEAREAVVSSLEARLKATLDKYRAALLASAPEVPQEMVQGQTSEELEASLARAREMVERIKRQVEAKAARERVPAGSPPRSPASASYLTPREKILYGLQRLGR